MKFNFGVTGVISMVLWTAIMVPGTPRRTLAVWSLAATAVFLIVGADGISKRHDPVHPD